MANGEIDLAFIAEQGRRMLDEMRALRREVADVRSLVLAEHDYVRRLERRQGELKDDLEIIIKMEIGGSVANVETRIDHLAGDQERLSERIAMLEGAGEG